MRMLALVTCEELYVLWTKPQSLIKLCYIRDRSRGARCCMQLDVKLQNNGSRTKNLEYVKVVAQ